jgi:plasmid stabilization system protein ParE
MKLRFTQQAKQDLDNIADYIREQNPKAALRVRAAIMTIQHPAREREHSDA